MTTKGPRTKRCAIYTRKSSEEGLEQTFNSLDAQREACEAYIKSQVHDGWRLIRDGYDDGGWSGGILQRPALQRLLAEITTRRVDIVVVYKVDRLTRSLADFAKIVEVFDANRVSFVSVTQQFNTTSSMGRLTLNMLLSFAQFEREITGERIRDKFAASKKKGMWMGGFPPLGYDIEDRKLVANVREAEAVRHIYERYLELGSVRALKQALDAEGLVGKVHETQSGRRWGGKPFARGALYRLLQNAIYRGKIAHKNDTYPGQHEAIVGADLWQAVQARLADKRIKRISGANLKSRSLLAGVLFDADGHRMTPTHAVKKGKRYRYYVSHSLITGNGNASPNAQRTPANEIEHLVMTRIRAFLCDEAQILDALSTSIQDPALLRRLITKAQELGEACSTKIIQDREGSLRSVINRIDVHVDKIDLHLSPARLCDVLEEKVLRSDSPVEPESSASMLNLTIPVRLRRGGKEMRMILTATDTRTSPAKPDPALINLIARGNALHRKLVASGSSIAELAASEGLHYSHVSRLVRLAFLSPEITEAIVQGLQPIDLTAKKLLRVSRIPVDWQDQRAVLGFE